MLKGSRLLSLYLSGKNDVVLLYLIPAAVKGDSGKQTAEYNLLCNTGQTAELRSSHGVPWFGIHTPQ